MNASVHWHNLDRIFSSDITLMVLHIVVQFIHSRFNFVFLCFTLILQTLQYPKTKENTIRAKNNIKLQHPQEKILSNLNQ